MFIGNTEEPTNLTASSATPTSAMDYFKTVASNGDSFNPTINNNNLIIQNNNTSIKNERLSPSQQMQSQSVSQHNGGNGDAQSTHSRYVAVGCWFLCE